MPFKILRLSKDDREEVLNIVQEYWGDHTVLSQGEIFYPAEMEGLKAVEQDRIVGILHFQIQDNQCEILTLASLTGGKGIGTALLDTVEVIAKNKGCRKICLSTTNDNTNALAFYQRRGFFLKALFTGQIKAYRKLKPAIPEKGEQGIPIRDEIRLEKNLD